MKHKLILPLILVSSALAADKLPASKLIEMSRQEVQSPAFREALLATAGADAVQKGTAFVGEGPEFLFAVEAVSKPQLFIDDKPGAGMSQLSGSNLWMGSAQLRTGHSHTFHYIVDGKRFGGNMNVPAYGPDSYQKPGVPEGKLSQKIVHTSTIYDGMVSDYWTYAPAQYDGSRPAAVMVWQDGQGHTNRNGMSRLMNVIDNLTYQKKIPVIVHIFIQPGDIEKAVGTPTFQFVSNFSKATGRTMKDSMRSTEYDTVSDRYVRFLRDEILPEVAKKYSMRLDGYSYAISGSSSGGIAAFNAAWQMPAVFSRVLSHVGTFTSIQWTPGQVEGGEILPFRVRKDPKRNIRVWLQDGSEDLENTHGSWPLQNIQMANSLKMGGYDFHLSFGNGPHSGAHAGAQMPESLTWLWRGYDSSKTEQTFEQEAAEREKPLFRVRIYNRDFE
jgi:enterochelin esterase-like enzyme